MTTEFAFALVTLFIHLLAIVLWMGGGLFMILVVRPTLVALPDGAGRPALRRIGALSDRYLTAAGWTAVVFGAISGIALRRAGEMLTLDTRWGWAITLGALISLVIVVAGTPDAIRSFRDGHAISWTRVGVLRAGWLRIAGFSLVLALMALARFS